MITDHPTMGRGQAIALYAIDKAPPNKSDRLMGPGSPLNGGMPSPPTNRTPFRPCVQTL